MGKIAFVFSGQGSQYSGMGKSLVNESYAACEIFKKADKIRPQTSQMCFNASKEELTKTINTQPCMFTVELAAVAALNEQGITPAALAGFSLGEIAALTVSQAVSFDEGFKLVCKRGELMQNSADNSDGVMVAVLKLDNKTVTNICKNYNQMYPVNYNCPGQIVVSGSVKEMDLFVSEIKSVGGRCIPLAVKGGFHSPFMENAAAELKTYLDTINISSPKIPLYSNVTALPYDDNIKDLLSNQVKSPVKWQQTIENMIKNEIDTFIEVGPGKTLSGLIKKISSDVLVYNVEDSESLMLTVKEVKNNA